MTDRVYALSVALEQDIRVDDVEVVISAIKMIRGVLSVEAHVRDMSQWAANERVRAELSNKLWAVLYPEAEGKR